MTNTESIQAKLANLHAVRAGRLAEIETLKARGAEINEAMMSGVEYDGEEFLQLAVKLTAASKQGEAVDEAIKAASVALKTSQWGDVLKEVRDHVAARPDIEGELKKLALSTRKKLASLEAAAREWDAANLTMWGRARQSPLRELRAAEVGNGYGNVPIVDDVAATGFAYLGHTDDWVAKATIKVRNEEQEAAKERERLENGPARGTLGQMIEATKRGVDVEQVIWEDENAGVTTWNKVHAASTSGQGNYVSNNQIPTAQLFPTNG